MRILLIENDNSDVEFLKQILKDDDIEVLDTVPEKLNKKYDLLIVDYFLDNKSSHEFILKLSKEKDFKTPVILISGKVDSISLTQLPASMNILVISKNDHFKELILYYSNLLCRNTKQSSLDYKTLFLNLVHDLKNDLTLCSLLEDQKQFKNEDELIELKNNIVNAAVFASSRIENLTKFLDLNKESYSTFSKAYESVIESPIIKDNIDRIKLIGDLNKEIPFISTYFLSVILKNLIENSCKYSNPAKALKVMVSYFELDDYYELTIDDNSLGMPEAKSSQLFNIAQSSDTGLGVGLMVLNRIISSFNGTVKIHSDVGVGTTIILTFPK